MLAAPITTAVDLGSGAGFPGLPIAILEPDATIELVDARRRRHHFQRAACRELGITNVRPRLGRIEEIAPTAAGLVVAQAVAPIRQVVEWAEPWVAERGWLVVPYAAAAPDLHELPGWEVAGGQEYGGGSPPRGFWSARRTTNAPSR